jgi:uncharacterized lipoprotein YddW (UPF0748 family)
MPRACLAWFSLVFGSELLGAEPVVPREFRGVWVATVANIDWPSKPGLPADDQKAEFRKIVGRCRELNLNAIVFQIRPMCDAFYESKLEPWSGFLTGKPGADPGYDPLAFAIEECHAAGMELHAWLNPYRAWHPSAKGAVPENHLVKTRPDLAKKYGKHHWLNPTHPDVPKHTLAVIADVVKRYDLDGIHLDDYFYPYPEQDADKKDIPFPDDDTWKAYQDSGGKLSRGDWRRDAVNQFVKAMDEQVHKLKPWVKVGISPFGIWRPNFPPGIQGFDQYGQLYADARLWLNEGWIDYLTPQLYWPIAQEKQSYPRLLKWWCEENAKKRHIWPGNIPSRTMLDKNPWPAAEFSEQIAVTRKQTGASGNIHFSMKPLMLNSNGINKELKKVYAEPALVPASPWLSQAVPAKPTIRFNAQFPDRWTLEGDATIRRFAVAWGDKPQWIVVSADAKGTGTFVWPEGKAPRQAWVISQDRFGTLSQPNEWSR